MARMTFPPGLNATAGHRHGAVEILYVLEGTMEHVVNGTSYVLTPGMAGVVRPGDDVMHRVRGTTPVRALVIWAPAGELGRIEPQFQPCPPR
jgi:mannose-6-phosphate isomerase-like protein (cupin superfamily)